MFRPGRYREPLYCIFDRVFALGWGNLLTTRSQIRDVRLRPLHLDPFGLSTLVGFY
jgi:hypothetical protein